MNTIEPLTSEQQQDHFTLSFVKWLNDNYRHTGDQIYMHVNDLHLPFSEVKYSSAAECLDLFRKLYIPQLPHLSAPSEHTILSIAQESARINVGLFAGYRKLQALLQEPKPVTNQQLSDIIIDTMAQISKQPTYDQ